MANKLYTKEQVRRIAKLYRHELYLLEAAINTEKPIELPSDEDGDTLKNETANGIKPVYCVFDDGNYYSIPQTIRIFNTEEKAINFCKAHPFEKYWWDEMEVE